MKNRRILSVILAVVMLFAVVPVVGLAESAAGIANEAAAITKLDNVWAQLDAAEAEAIAGGAEKTEVISAVFSAALNTGLVNIDSFSVLICFLNPDCGVFRYIFLCIKPDCKICR